jgi:hypothetical protein
MTDKMIRRFRLDGLIVETAFVRSASNLRLELMNQMRDEGYVPVIDISPVFKTNYLGGERYEFSLVMHGVYVGEEKAWVTAGMLDGRLIPNTPRTK